MRAERVALVASFLLEKIVAHEDLVLIELQSLAVAAEQIAAKHDLVEQVPLAVVEQRALTHLVKHVPPRIKEVVLRLDVLLLVLALQRARHALVGGVVVHVAHDNHLCARVLLHQRLFEGIDLLAGALADFAACRARGPVIDDKMEFLASQFAAHHEKAARDVRGVAFKFGVGVHLLVFVHIETEVDVGLIFVLIIIWYEHRAFEREEAGVVEESTFHASAVGPVVVYDLPAALLQCRLFQEVFEHVAVFDFRHSDDRRAGRKLVGAEFREHARHVVELCLVLHLAPLVAPVGKKLIIVLAGIVQRVEQIFKVVKCHAIERVTLLALLRSGERRQNRRRKEQE